MKKLRKQRGSKLWQCLLHGKPYSISSPGQSAKRNYQVLKGLLVKGHKNRFRYVLWGCIATGTRNPFIAFFPLFPTGNQVLNLRSYLSQQCNPIIFSFFALESSPSCFGVGKTFFVGFY